MRKELEFFLIDNVYYGGNQEWAKKWMMNKGGCSAVCACETCIALAKTFPGISGLYPHDPFDVHMAEFMDFFERMFKYVHPGIGGLTSIHKFSRMLGEYVATTGTRVRMSCLSGNETYEKAEAYVINAIDKGLPLMYLMLSHADRAFDDYEWHWFTVTGYEQSDDGLIVTFATWGLKHKFNLRRAWDTKMAFKGGMVRMGPVEL